MRLESMGLAVLLLSGCSRGQSTPLALASASAAPVLSSTSELGPRPAASNAPRQVATLPTRAELTQLRSELKHALGSQLLPFWYPRMLSERGGFVQRVISDGKPEDDGARFLVYQSRLTWVAAEVARRYPELRAQYLPYVRHGLAFLQNKAWDAQQGGFYFELGADGKPLAEKHVYGIAFAIYACAAAARATGDAKDAAFAERAFDWLDQHAHDAEHGGYYEPLTRAGKPVLTSTAAGEKDAIGTQYGRKSMNTHIHVLEALTELYRVRNSPRLRARLEEMFLIVRDKLTAADGHFHVYVQPDYQPISAGAKDSYGHNIEGAFLLLEAAEVLGKHGDAATFDAARRLADHALSHGWDAEHGGLYNEGEAGGSVSDRQKVWWVQAESLNGFLAVHAAQPGSDPRYLAALLQQWRFIQRHVLDGEHGEWRGYLNADGSSADPKQDLATKWKAAYHSGRALMQSVQLLDEILARQVPVSKSL